MRIVIAQNMALWVGGVVWGGGTSHGRTKGCLVESCVWTMRRGVCVCVCVSHYPACNAVHGVYVKSRCVCVVPKSEALSRMCECFGGWVQCIQGENVW